MLQPLRKPSFAALTATQFLGAFNDNAFKQLVLLLVLGSTPWVRDSWLAREGHQALPSALFSLPFVLFGALTGALADRCSKSAIIKAANLLEIAVMGLALVAFVAESYGLLLVMVFLMGTQSAIFGPSKYGSIPELLEPEDVSRGNAIVQMTTMIAILVGILVAGKLLDAFPDRLWIPGVSYVGFAALGWGISLRIDRLPARDPGRRLDWNVAAELRRHWRATEGDRGLVLSVVASAFFYLVAATLVLVVNAYGAALELTPGAISALNAFTILGIVVGSGVAGRVSGDRVEPGLVPIGLLGMAASLFLVLAAPHSVVLLRSSLFGLGVSAGLFTIPIRVLIQTRPRPSQRGSVLGLSETLDFVGILTAAGVYHLLDRGLGLEPPSMFLVLGVAVLAFTFGSLFYTAEFAVRLVLLCIARAVYRIRLKGPGAFPREGGALLVANHVSFVDAVLVGVAAPRPVSFLMYRGFFRVPLLGWFARRMGAIPIAAGDDREAKRAAIADAAARLAEGQLVCIFAEGAITRSGALLPFARGLERIAQAAGAPIVPLALDRLWGSVFSFEGGRAFWKRPRRLPYPVDVIVGTPLPPETPAWRVRLAIAELVADERTLRAGRRGSLAWRFLASARRHARRTAIVEDGGRPLRYRALLVRVLALRRTLARHLGPDPVVGVLLPPGAGGVVAELTLALLGRTSVHLNATLSDRELAELCAEAGVRRIVTSRRYLAALGREGPLPGGSVALEDLAPEVPRADVVRAWLASWLPTVWLGRLAPQRSAREVATIVFSSGSTGRPKGVLLTHANVLSNVQGVLQLVPLGPGDGVLSVLPLFHSFGYTVTTWLPLLAGAKLLCHPDPFDVAAIGRLCREHGATFAAGTPTLYRTWLRRLEPADLAHLRVALAGAEKLPAALSERWRERFGSPLYEGYGCTELSPVVAVNVPDLDTMGTLERGHVPGTVGRPLPGIAVRIVDRPGGELLAPDEEGLLEVKGPSVMAGYLGRPEETAAAIHDGWYATGDVARLRADGFLEITDRAARFSKIGGEMVPHGRVEEALHGAAGALGLGAEVEFVVVGLADEAGLRGERLVVLHTELGRGVDELLVALRRSGLPALFVPKRADFVCVDALPRLGSGKVDLAGARGAAAVARDAAAEA